MPDDRFGSVRDLKDVRKNQKRPTRNGEMLLIAVLFLFVVGIAFELYGHYAYVHTVGRSVTRIDRFTGDACVMPCSGDAQKAPAAANVGAVSDDSKTCHTANVVRVAGSMKIPPGRPPYPYHQGGIDPATSVVKNWRHDVVSNAAELTDGHIYVFSASSFAAVGTWSTGDSVEVCAIYSKIEQRPFFSIREAEGAEPADIAI
jgi:hypothetical protein